MTAPAASSPPTRPDSAPSHAPGHAPVLRAEALDHLAPGAGETHVDATFGAGGYSRALLEAGAGRVVAIDRDPEAAPRAEALAAEAAAAGWGDLAFLPGRFGEMDRLLAEAGIEAVQGVVFDLGVSSMQLDRAERGFSFQKPAALDMRMESAGPTAADLVNSARESELIHILKSYGEERRARAVARAIGRRRTRAPIARTDELAALIRAVVPAASDGLDPATRSFQALRMAVNDEPGELARGLAAAERILAPGGRLVAVSFHSVEDRIVKQFLHGRSGRAPRGSRHLPESGETRAPSFLRLTAKPVRPDAAEIQANPRARSARLRAARRTDAAPWPVAAPEGADLVRAALERAARAPAIKGGRP